MKKFKVIYYRQPQKNLNGYEYTTEITAESIDKATAKAKEEADECNADGTCGYMKFIKVEECK